MMILDLPLKRKWYEMIESGIKTEEYREFKPYWCCRLVAYKRIKPEISAGFPITWTPPHYSEWKAEDCYIRFKNFTHVRFRYGYTKRTMLREIESITIGYGKPEWGAPTDRQVFIIKFKKGGEQ